MYNKVELCGMNTAKLPVLTEAEKRELLARAHAGDAAAREQMVEGNLRLVLSVVQRFAQRGENLDDLFQVGCIGLIKAIDHFDPAQPVRFSTYGVPMIIGEIRRFLRDNNSIRVSRSLRDTNKVKSFIIRIPSSRGIADSFRFSQTMSPTNSNLASEWLTMLCTLSALNS